MFSLQEIQAQLQEQQDQLVHQVKVLAILSAVLLAKCSLLQETRVQWQQTTLQGQPVRQVQVPLLSASAVGKNGFSAGDPSTMAETSGYSRSTSASSEGIYYWSTSTESA